MAEEVIIKFDIGVATNNIARLEAELKKVKQEYKAAEIGSKDFYKAQDAGKQLTEQIKKQNDALKANTNALNGVNQAAKFQVGSYGELKQRIKELKDEQLKLKINSTEFIKVTDDLAKAEQARIDIEKELPSLFKERIKGAIEEANSIKAIKEEMKSLTSVFLAGGEGSAEASKRLAELQDKLDDVKDATKVLKGSGVEALTSSMGELKDSIVNFDGGKFTNALKGIGGAMKAIPIFLILEGIKLLVENFDAVFKFAQSFTDSAKEVKKLTKEYEALQVANARNTATVNAAITVQEAELGLLQAQGASNDVILAQEQRIYKSKLELLKVQAIQLKADGMLALAKKREILDNDSIEESSLRLAKSLTNDKKTQEILDLTIANSKKERAKEADKQLEDSFNGAKALSAELTALQLGNEAKIISTNKDTTEKRIDASRQIKQAEIDNIENVYQRQLAQIQFDEDNALEDLKRSKDFYGKKAQLEKEILEKARQENINAAREEKIRLEGIANELSQAKIDLIKNDFERSQEQIKLNEKIALENAENTIINNAALLFETKKNITAKYAEEERKLALDYVTKDLKAQQELIIETQTSTLTEIFAAKQELLNQQRESELITFQGTEQERLLLEEKYANDSIKIERDKVEAKKNIRNSEIEFAKQAALALANVALIFSKDQEQQAAVAKTIALINIAANTATAISGLTAISFAPTNGDNAFNPLGPYLKLAAGIVAITSNIAQAKQVINSFEEGGYTGDGAPNEVSTNLGSKPYTYHKSEYVIPARVLGTPQGNMLAAQAESMRLGMSNPMPYIGGMFDGGFTARSAGAEANSSISNNAMLNQLLGNLPTPVVRVTDINKVQGDAIRVSQTSSL
jgi:hypothetical protein